MAPSRKIGGIVRFEMVLRGLPALVFVLAVGCDGAGWLAPPLPDSPEDFWADFDSAEYESADEVELPLDLGTGTTFWGVYRIEQGWVVAGERIIGRLEDLAASGGVDERAAVMLNNRWNDPNNEVHYFVDDVLFSPAEVASIVAALQAMDSWSPLTFVRESVPLVLGPSINIGLGAGCSSWFGPAYSVTQPPVPVPNPIFLTSGCALDGFTVQHEVQHALGFHHEQQRHDRGDHIEYFSQNLKAGWDINFDFDINGVSTAMTPFNFRSGMLYGSIGSSKNGYPVMTMKDTLTVASAAPGAPFGGNFPWTRWVTDVDVGSYEDFATYEFADFGCGVPGCAPGVTDIFRAVESGITWDWEILYGDAPQLGWQQAAGSFWKPSHYLFGDINGDGETDVIVIEGRPWFVSYSGVDQPVQIAFVPSGPREDPEHLRVAHVLGKYDCAEIVSDEGGGVLWEAAAWDCPGTGPVSQSALSWTAFRIPQPLGFTSDDIVFGDFTDHSASGVVTHDILYSGPNMELMVMTNDVGNNGEFESPIDKTGVNQSVVDFDQLLTGDIDGDDVEDLFIRQTNPAWNCLGGTAALGWIAGAADTNPFAAVVGVLCAADLDSVPQMDVLALGNFTGGTGAPAQGEILSAGLFGLIGNGNNLNLPLRDRYDHQRSFADSWEIAAEFGAGTALVNTATPGVGVNWADMRSTWVTASMAGWDLEDVAFGDFDGDGVTDHLKRFTSMDLRVDFGTGLPAEPVVGFFNAGSQNATVPSPWNVPDFDELLIGNFLPGAEAELLWVENVSGSDEYFAWSPVLGGNPVSIGPAVYRLGHCAAGDFDDDGLDDVLSVEEASSSGDWFIAFAETTVPWSGWTKVCSSICSGQTIDNIFLGDFDGTGDVDVFSDNYAPYEWWYYDVEKEGGWVYLGEFAARRPDILAGEFDSTTGTDILRIDSGQWEISSGARNPFARPVPGPGDPPGDLRGIRIVDLDSDGLDEVTRQASVW